MGFRRSSSRKERDVYTVSTPHTAARTYTGKMQILLDPSDGAKANLADGISCRLTEVRVFASGVSFFVSALINLLCGAVYKRLLTCLCAAW